jgi:hypothetical protein
LAAARNAKLSNSEDWPAEKRLAEELKKLSERVRKLREEIRGSAIGPAEARHRPTESERRPRSVAADQKVRRKTQKRP